MDHMKLWYTGFSLKGRGPPFFESRFCYRREPLYFPEILSACAEGYSNQNAVCLSLAGSHHYDTQNKHQCQANYVSFILKKTDFLCKLRTALRHTACTSTVLHSRLAHARIAVKPM